VLVFPDGASLPRIADSLNSLFPTVVYAHPNVIGTTTGAGANDSLYSEQASLHPTSSYPNAHINVEEAWEYETGKPFVKAGIFDTGIDWEHEDFGYDGSNSESSVVKGGWDFRGKAPLKSGFKDHNGHGTYCAGIVGAVRNNSIGVAGVAGGNDSLAQKGVSLYGYNIFRLLSDINVNFISSELSYIADAIIGSAIDDSTKDYGHGLHIMSHSWRIEPRIEDVFTDDNITLFKEAAHFANRCHVSFVASRGNEGKANKAYPAIIDDDWILCVGGAGTNGLYSVTGENSNYTASFGWEVDVAAPSASQTIRTLKTKGGYSQFSRTSAATPHVAGTAALLMSYHNSPLSSYNNLAPEDIEFLIQFTANDLDFEPGLIGVDSLTGHGLVDAGAALVAIDKESRMLKHYDVDSLNGSFRTFNLLSGRRIKTEEEYMNRDSTWFDAGYYDIDLYRIYANVGHNIPLDYEILEQWPRHSSSNLLPQYDNDSILLPRERVSLESYSTQDTAFLIGHVYKVYDTSGNYLGWWPFDTTESNYKVAYTLLLIDTQFVVTGNEEYVAVEPEINIFPNPSFETQTLEILSNDEQHIRVMMYDIYGREVKTVYSGSVKKGKNLFTVNISSFPDGVYLYSIKGKDYHAVRKMIKNR